MYSNNVLNFQESMTILNACTKKSLETYWIHHVYDSLISHGLFPEKQKGCHMEIRGTGDLWYIDIHILKESKMRRKNVTMARIDYQKSYNMAPPICIVDFLKMYKISDEVKTMKNWRVKMTTGGKLRKYTGGYKLHKLQERINQWMMPKMKKNWKP